MTTKLELTQLLAERNTALEAARLRISVLEGELALRPRSQKAQQGVCKPLPAHFVAAREAAMRLGCSVRVTA